MEVSGFKGFIISSVPSPCLLTLVRTTDGLYLGKSSCYVLGTVFFFFFLVAFVCFLCVCLFVFQSKQLSLPERNRRGLPEAILTPIYPMVLLSITGLQCFLNRLAARQLWMCRVQFSSYSNFMGLSYFLGELVLRR